MCDGEGVDFNHGVCPFCGSSHESKFGPINCQGCKRKFGGGLVSNNTPGISNRQLVIGTLAMAVAVIAIALLAEAL